MVDIIGFIPLTIPGIVAMFLDSLLAAVVIILADKIIAHNIEAKHAFMISGIALFIAPILGAFAASYIALPGFIFAYILPLLVWVALGEILLQADRMAKVKVMAVAFVVYLVLSFTVGPRLISLVAGILPV